MALYKFEDVTKHMARLAGTKGQEWEAEKADFDSKSIDYVLAMWMEIFSVRGELESIRESIERLSQRMPL